MTSGRLLTGWVVAASALLLVNASGAQPLPDSSFSYVASITPSQPGTPGFSEYLPGGRLTATAVTVRTLMRLAYRVQDYQLMDAPGWVSKRWDISAKVEDAASPPQPVFLRALLKDRFRLAIHNETRRLPIFALVPARSDGRLGPQLIRSDFDCAAYRQRPHAPPEPGRTPACATNIRVGAVSGKAIPMAQLATSLAPFLQRFTVDRTGLTGGFDVELTWTPEPVSGSPDSAPGESIFSAIQEQLGLKLISEKGPVEVLVIDHAEEPSEN